jgi:hypothetical protein
MICCADVQVGRKLKPTDFTTGEHPRSLWR